MSEPVRALVVTGGHPFDAAAFDELLAGLDGVACTRVAHPEAAALLHPDRLEGHEVVVLYDMPGIRFRAGQTPELVPPPDEVVRGLAALTAAGVGIVALHHALAGWPAWPAYAEILGGCFHYVPATLAGTSWPDSGYAFDVRQRLTVVAPWHPVCAGLPPVFDVVDETYCATLLPDDLVPLLVTDAPLDDAHHAGALGAVTGAPNRGWTHPPMAPLAAWAKRAGRSPLVYVQPGDGPGAYANAHYRRLLANAILWVAGPQARAWAAAGRC